MSRICILVVAIFLINLIATRFHLYTLIWWFDMPMHFFGGFFVVLVTLWLKFFTKIFNFTPFKSKNSFLFIGILSALIVGLFWELFEYGVQSITGVILTTFMDSLSDIFFDLAGGIAAVLYVEDQLSKTTEASGNTLYYTQ